MMNVLSYRILLREEPEGGYTVTVPSLPGCVTYGKTVDEAREMAKEAIELYVESLRAHGEEVPPSHLLQSGDKAQSGRASPPRRPAKRHTARNPVKGT